MSRYSPFRIASNVDVMAISNATTSYTTTPTNVSANEGTTFPFSPLFPRSTVILPLTTPHILPPFYLPTLSQRLCTPKMLILPKSDG